MARIHRGLGALALAATNLCSVAALAAESGAPGVLQEAQAAWLREDAAALARLAAATAAQAKAAAPEQRYAYAFVQFRLQQLALGGGRKADATAAGENCLAALAPAVDAGRDAESLALASACHGYLANLGGLKAISNGPKSRKRIDAALAVAPTNPRVVFVDGLNYYFAPSAFGGDKSKALQRFKAASKLFAESGAVGAPPWGEAECWLFIGRASADAGDAAAAAAAYAKAREIAPEFAAARRRAGAAKTG
jgi:tetratricopeptide (TPR) repeat protein